MNSGSRATTGTAGAMPVPGAAKSDIGLVILWMTGALLSFSVLAVSIRSLAGTLSVFEIFSIRSTAGVVILLLLAMVKPQLRAAFIPHRIALQGIRNTVHFAAQIMWGYGVTVLPLATVFALEFTTPAWLALLAVFFLRERLTVSRIGAVALGFLGVLVIVRPGFAAFKPESFVVVGAAVGYAIAAIATKKLTATESTFAILLWMNVMQLPMNLIGSDLLFPLKLHAAQILPVIGIAVSGLSAHFCQANAFRHGDATIVMPLDFLRLPLIAIIGASFYGEALDVMVFVGAAFIITGILWNLFTEARR